jgi:MFS transporter, DHA1 family, multidrug resistance protein
MTTSSRAPPLTLLALATALAPSALHMLVPALPLLAIVFDRSPAAAQLTLTLYLVGPAAGQLVYGPISDRFGRRPVLLAGIVLFLCGTALCGFAWSLPVLLVGRTLEACGGCAGMVLGRAIIRDAFDRERSASALATIMMAMSLAPSISPAIGGYLAEWAGWRADLALLGGLGAIVLALAAAKLEETHRPAARLDFVGMLGCCALLLRSPAFLAFSVASAFTSASWFTFTGIAPYLLSRVLHEPLSTYGLMILWPMAAYILGSAVAARLTVRLGIARMFVAGLALSLGSGALLALWVVGFGLSAWAMFIPMALSSIGNGISQPAGVAAGLSVYPRLAGTASGLMGFLQMIAAALGTVIVGVSPHDSGLWMVVVVGSALALAFFCGLLPLGVPAVPPVQLRLAFRPANEG